MNALHNDNDAISAYRDALHAAIDARAEYERAKNEDNDTMQAKLKTFKRDTTHDAIVDTFMLCNVSANTINHAMRSNARFNEKAFVKVINIARTLCKVDALNIYTRAIFDSIKAFEDAELALTESEARACCSADSKLSDKTRNKLLRKTAKVYNASTASTQASSTVQALRAFNVIREERDASGQTVFRLNRESEATIMLLAA